MLMEAQPRYPNSSSTYPPTPRAVRSASKGGEGF
jgi:hypothetical protein